MKGIYFFYCCLMALFISCKWCKDTDSLRIESMQEAESPIPADSLTLKPIEIKLSPVKKAEVIPLSEVHDTVFINLKQYSSDFVYDLKYATTDNFLKAKVYNCAECYTRAITAKALIKANTEFLKQGYRIKFFDCYRPNSVQWKMWELVPNPQYVANPEKGSIHNKGGAVDITLTTLNGEELDMGTGFDFFGKKAHHDYTDLTDRVLANRQLLKTTMEKYGFWSIRTEWWHYNLSEASNYPVADFKWKCE